MKRLILFYFLTTTTAFAEATEQRFSPVKQVTPLEKSIELSRRANKYEPWALIENKNDIVVREGEQLRICFQSGEDRFLRLWLKQTKSGYPIKIAPNRLTKNKPYSLSKNRVLKMKAGQKFCLGGENDYEPMFQIKESNASEYDIWLESAESANAVLGSSFAARLMSGKNIPAPLFSYTASPSPSRNEAQSCKDFSLNKSESSTSSLDARIVGGDNVSIKKLPWQAALLNKNSKKPFCGAAFLTDQWLVTASHCLDTKLNEGQRWLPSTAEVVIGYGSAEVNQFKVAPVSNIIIHPEWNVDEGPALGNDIALVKLSKPIKFDNTSQPISPSGKSASNLSGSCSVVSGWGKVANADNAPTSNFLLKAALPLVGKSQCREMISASGKSTFPAEDQFCAGGGTKDSCQGDSGGPIVIRDSSTGKARLLGVVSWGYECALQGVPGVYTDLKYHESWIREQMQK